MKRAMLAFLLVAGVAMGRTPILPFPPPPVADNWTTVAADLMTVSGQVGVVPIPARAEFVPGLGYAVRPPFITHFIVRVGPGSQQRGCVPLAGESGAVTYTGVTSTQPFIKPTQLISREFSSSLPNWLNYEFSVNGGVGAVVQSINPVFARTDFPVQCFYQLLWRNVNEVQTRGAIAAANKELGIGEEAKEVTTRGAVRAAPAAPLSPEAQKAAEEIEQHKAHLQLEVIKTETKLQ